MKRGKHYRQVAEKIPSTENVVSNEAMQLVVDTQRAKFDESVEVHVRISIDTKKGDQQVRGAVVLPHGTGKTKKVAVATTAAAKDAKDAGADLVAGEDIVESIKSGKFFEEGYDVLVATPEMMPKLAPVAKILGPRGLMPSPKSETVTPKVKEAVESLKKGKINFKNDNTGNIHQVIGKTSFGAQKLEENYKAFMSELEKQKPASLKGKFISSMSICSTMGPSIKIAL